MQVGKERVNAVLTKAESANRKGMFESSSNRRTLTSPTGSTAIYGIMTAG